MPTLSEQYTLGGQRKPENKDLSPQLLPGQVPNVVEDVQKPSIQNSGRYYKELTIGGSSGRRVRITGVGSQNPEQNLNSIAIIDANNNIVAGIGDITGGAATALYANDYSAVFAASFSRSAAVSGSTAPVVGMNDNAADTSAAVLEMGTAASTNDGTTFNASGSFSKIIGLIGTAIVYVWVSDGTNPNGSLSGSQGDICLNASATGQIAYCSGTTTWTLL